MENFVYLDEFAPHILTDAKYAGSDNFLGRPVCGYEAPRVCCLKEMAEKLVRIERRLNAQGLRMIVFDSYRPQRAVNDFMRWMRDIDDQVRKPIHYPNTDKRRMVELGYIIERSGHSRGCAVDLTLARMDGTPLEMGTCFDFMDERSHHGAAGISETAAANRALLCRFMTDEGMQPLQEEWWHYTLDPEPFPDTFFDFPIV